jgi:acyl dehydratase
MNEKISASELPGLVGRELPPSDWFEISQERVNRFADASNDHQFIHTDVAQAAQTPFGGTIVHGFLTLSLLPFLSGQILPEIRGLKMAINYGSDRVRFLQPVRVGSRIRAHQNFVEASERSPGQWLVKSQVSIEIDGQEKPALVADTLSMFVV